MAHRPGVTRELPAFLDYSALNKLTVQVVILFNSKCLFIIRFKVVTAFGFNIFKYSINVAVIGALLKLEIEIGKNRMKENVYLTK